MVTAVVNGRSELLDLTISAAAVRGAHPQQIGPAAVAAITAARHAAMAAALPQVRAVLDDKLDWHPTPPSPDLRHPAPPAPQERAATATPETPSRQVEDESFEDLDFLTDDEDDTDRGLW